MYGKVSGSFFLSFLLYIGHGVAAICQFVEIRRHRGSRGIQLGCARLARWQSNDEHAYIDVLSPLQLDNQAIQHLHRLTDSDPNRPRTSPRTPSFVLSFIDSPPRFCFYLQTSRLFWLSHSIPCVHPSSPISSISPMDQRLPPGDLKL
jgi:hypothetical protein